MQRLRNILLYLQTHRKNIKIAPEIVFHGDTLLSPKGDSLTTFLLGVTATAWGNI